MMLKFRDIFYEEYDNELTTQKKEKKLNEIQETENNDDFVEFLYLNGSDKGWKWGMNGMTNAAFIEEELWDRQNLLDFRYSFPYV